MAGVDDTTQDSFKALIAEHFDEIEKFLREGQVEGMSTSKWLNRWRMQADRHLTLLQNVGQMLEDQNKQLRAELIRTRIEAGLPVDSDDVLAHFGVDPDNIEPLTEDDIVSSR